MMLSCTRETVYPNMGRPVSMPDTPWISGTKRATTLHRDVPVILLLTFGKQLLNEKLEVLNRDVDSNDTNYDVSLRVLVIRTATNDIS